MSFDICASVEFAEIITKSLLLIILLSVHGLHFSPSVLNPVSNELVAY